MTVDRLASRPVPERAVSTRESGGVVMRSTAQVERNPPTKPKGGESHSALEKRLERLEQMLAAALGAGGGGLMPPPIAPPPRAKGRVVRSRPQAYTSGASDSEGVAPRARVRRTAVEPRRIVERSARTRDGRTYSSVAAGGSAQGRCLPTLPPPAAKSRTGDWVEVVGRKRRRMRLERDRPAPSGQVPSRAPPRTAPGTASRPSPLPRGRKQEVPATAPRRRPAAQLARPPRTAAVTITIAPGAEQTYSDVVSRARQAISLDELGIGEGQLRPKRAATGGLIFEVSGKDGRERAKALAEKLTELYDPSGPVKIGLPTKFGEVRVSGLDDSARLADIVAAVSRVGGCRADEVRVGEIRSSPRGLGSAWVRCPLPAARKVVEGGRLWVGWSAASVMPLETRPLQCYRCLAFGHVRLRCTAAVERGDRCFRCGSAGHRAASCREAPKCLICAEKGLDAVHRMGGTACTAAHGTGKSRSALRRRKKRERAAAAAAPSIQNGSAGATAGSGGSPSGPTAVIDATPPTAPTGASGTAIAAESSGMGTGGGSTGPQPQGEDVEVEAMQLADIDPTAAAPTSALVAGGEGLGEAMDAEHS